MKENQEKFGDYKSCGRNFYNEGAELFNVTSGQIRTWEKDIDPTSKATFDEVFKDMFAFSRKIRHKGFRQKCAKTKLERKEKKSGEKKGETAKFFEAERQLFHCVRLRWGKARVVSAYFLRSEYRKILRELKARYDKKVDEIDPVMEVDHTAQTLLDEANLAYYGVVMHAEIPSIYESDDPSFENYLLRLETDLSLKTAKVLYEDLLAALSDTENAYLSRELLKLDESAIAAEAAFLEHGADAKNFGSEGKKKLTSARLDFELLLAGLELKVAAMRATALVSALDSKDRLLFFEKRNKLMNSPFVTDVLKSSAWIHRFTKRWYMSYLKANNKKRQVSRDNFEVWNAFFASVFLTHRAARYSEEDIYNMDESPLCFWCMESMTYSQTGSNHTSVATGTSNDKRSASLMIAFRGKGGASPKMGIIYAGMGTVYNKECDQYPDNVQVFFQPKAWCDVGIMQQWVVKVWWPHILEHHKQADGSIKPTILFMDNLGAHQAVMIRELFKKCGTRVFFYPPGETDNLQPVDGGFAKNIKVKISRSMEMYFDEYPLIEEQFLEGQFSASMKRIILSKMVGSATEDVFANPENLRVYFLKTGSYVGITEELWAPEKCSDKSGIQFVLRPPTADEEENFVLEVIPEVKATDVVDMETAKVLALQYPLKSSKKSRKAVKAPRNTLNAYFVTPPSGSPNVDEDEDENLDAYDDDGDQIEAGAEVQLDFSPPHATIGIFKRNDEASPLTSCMSHWFYQPCDDDIDWESTYLDALSGSSIMFLWDNGWMRGVIRRISYEAEKVSIACGCDINGVEHDEVNNARVVWTDNNIEDVFLSEKTLLTSDQFCMEMAEVEEHRDYHPCHSWFLVDQGAESGEINQKIEELRSTTYDSSGIIEGQDEDEEEEEIAIVRQSGRARAPSRKAQGLC